MFTLSFHSLFHIFFRDFSVNNFKKIPEVILSKKDLTYLYLSFLGLPWNIFYQRNWRNFTFFHSRRIFQNDKLGVFVCNFCSFFSYLLFRMIPLSQIKEIPDYFSRLTNLFYLFEIYFQFFSIPFSEIWVVILFHSFQSHFANWPTCNFCYCFLSIIFHFAQALVFKSTHKPAKFIFFSYFYARIVSRL